MNVPTWACWPSVSIQVSLFKGFIFSSLSFMSSLYILECPSLAVWCTYNFSHTVGFVLMQVPFTVQKLLVCYCPICLILLLFPLPWSPVPRLISKSVAKEYIACHFFYVFYSSSSLCMFDLINILRC